MKPTNFPRRKEKRRLEAKIRQDKYDKLSLEEKLAKAGKKQRKKLLKKHRDVLDEQAGSLSRAK